MTAAIGTSVVCAVDHHNDAISTVAESPPREVPPSILQHTTSTRRHCRILLHGPQKSGRTSLLMNLASRVAAETPCRCSQQTCECIAVLFFRMHDTNSTYFPLPCQKVLLEPLIDQSTGGWQPDLLKRIQVVHVQSARDIYSKLLALQGQAPYKLPWGGIFIDNLDQVTGKGVQNVFQHALRMTQLCKCDKLTRASGC
jgi:hypothetical protein